MIASGNPDASVVDSLASSVINELRQQYSRMSQQEADVSRRYGAEHEAAQKARRQMEDINGLILKELGRIEQVYKSDLEVAMKQEAGPDAVDGSFHDPFVRHRAGAGAPARTGTERRSGPEPL